ncbi:hypothetical protein LNKW23_34480 [Paralimibaculum aggregatum]|uniref:DUF3306 domain-containing protein n=1 Tax=Paralimibaculum aggregatum TaxID=3036245 RepID=A0ABQ6LRI2_9RHOB|nr:DUF3306 domain-containing protein [Limibaculum sp. NKW23]GMG84233.1 hypothetical protein LNKW23_34480 [Limibaculum sp. NKW23]
MSGGDSDGEGMLSRWSRRKRAAAAEPEAEPAAAVPAGPEPAAEPEPEKTDEEILAEHGLPDPDDLKPGDDIRGFMNKAIPTRLRNRALRKLWVSNPVLANLDGLVDYGEDFTDAATVVENLASAWEVGRGYPKPEPVPEREPEAEDGDQPADTPEAGGAEPAPEAANAEPDAESPALEPPAPPSAPASGGLARAPRRMRFAIGESETG